jgi:hypothetical protein
MPHTVSQYKNCVDSWTLERFDLRIRNLLSLFVSRHYFYSIQVNDLQSQLLKEKQKLKVKHNFRLSAVDLVRITIYIFLKVKWSFLKKILGEIRVFRHFFLNIIKRKGVYWHDIGYHNGLELDRRGIEWRGKLLTISGQQHYNNVNTFFQF